MWNLKKYNKLVKKTNPKKDIEKKNRKQTSGYQWREGRGDNIGVGNLKRVIMGLHAARCVKFLKVVKYYRM